MCGHDYCSSSERTQIADSLCRGTDRLLNVNKQVVGLQKSNHSALNGETEAFITIGHDHRHNNVIIIIIIINILSSTRPGACYGLSPSLSRLPVDSLPLGT